MCIHFFFAVTDNAAMNIFVHKSLNYPSNYVLRVDIFKVELLDQRVQTFLRPYIYIYIYCQGVSQKEANIVPPYSQQPPSTRRGQHGEGRGRRMGGGGAGRGGPPVA